MLGEGTACEDDDDDDDWRDLSTSWPSVDSVASVHFKKNTTKIITNIRNYPPNLP